MVILGHAKLHIFFISSKFTPQKKIKKFLFLQTFKAPPKRHLPNIQDYRFLFWTTFLTTQLTDIPHLFNSSMSMLHKPELTNSTDSL